MLQHFDLLIVVAVVLFERLHIDYFAANLERHVQIAVELFFEHFQVERVKEN